MLNQENETDYHRPWADEMKKKYSFTKDNATEIIRQEVGQIFSQVLADAGVFKRNEQGQAAFMRFIQTLRRKTMATIKDIANLAQVSPATVSRVLNYDMGFQ